MVLCVEDFSGSAEVSCYLMFCCGTLVRSEAHKVEPLHAIVLRTERKNRRRMVGTRYHNFGSSNVVVLETL